MATSYNIYANDGLNGPVDYSTIIATTSSLTYTGPDLASPSDTTFAVRATDGTSEEQNIDCRVRIIIDADGNDVSAIPNAPTQFSAIATSGGGARLDWLHVPMMNVPVPTEFKVWLTSGSSVDYTAPPAETVLFSPRQYRYTVGLTGLSDGVTYSIGIRATNAGIDEANTIKASVTGLASGPSAVSGLTGSSTYTP